jgi:hypothetical protein
VSIPQHTAPNLLSTASPTRSQYVKHLRSLCHIGRRRCLAVPRHRDIPESHVYTLGVVGSGVLGDKRSGRRAHIQTLKGSNHRRERVTSRHSLEGGFCHFVWPVSFALTLYIDFDAAMTRQNARLHGRLSARPRLVSCDESKSNGSIFRQSLPNRVPRGSKLSLT